jgi:2,5-dihydroxypyridine 5,6-dioxygenase
MLTDRIEGKWIDAFKNQFALCAIQPGDTVAILSESQSRALNVHLSELALGLLGARTFHLVVPTPRQTAPVPVRSTGASQAIGNLAPVVAALASSTMVVDVTVEGLLHAPELPQILKGGARVMMVSNEHPEVLERLPSDPALQPKVRAGLKKLRGARQMRVTSAAGTDLTIQVAGAPIGGTWGFAEKPGMVAHWPGGLCLCFPKSGTVNGSVVLAPGDLNLTFKRYIETPVALTIEGDFITSIAGTGVDAALFESYMNAWGDRNAYAVSHAGWGMNPKARWDTLACYDKAHVNGTEARAFAGNFLFSTGANETAGRYTEGHFDLPMRGCTIALDGEVIVDKGVLQGELA